MSAAAARVRAPELPGPGAVWFNSPPLHLRELRGRFVLLDFWTFCCANCLHVLQELRALEAEFADVLTVIGIHSPKFAHEREPAAVAAAVERYEVPHPVLSDPDLRLWQQYAVKAWPTLVLIDPDGYVIAQAAGEGQGSALAAQLRQARDRYRLRPGPGPGSAARPGPLRERQPELRYPAKAVVLPAARTGLARDTVLVADAGGHALVHLDPSDGTVLRRIGGGSRGHRDGVAPLFAEPNGLALLPAGLAAYDVLVADTANHVLRTVRLDTGAAGTIDLVAGLAGARTVTGPVPAVLSPWDVAWWPAIDRAIVAAAGVHLLLAVDLRTGRVQVLAGTTVEGLRDGPARDGWLAQPSGLAVDAAAGDRLWFVDAETSALRQLTAAGALHTAVGEGLFDFGHVDGPAARARLQHPLGVTALPDGSVAVSDTYNGAIRRYRPQLDRLDTLAEGLAEPSGAVLLDGRLLVVESAAHTLRPIGAAPTDDAAPADGAAPADEAVGTRAALRTERPPTAVHAGTVQLQIAFTAPPGRKLDDRYGPAIRLTVSASPPELLQSGAGESHELARTLTLAAGSGVLHVTAQAASCDDGGEHPACYLARQDWGVPLTVGAGGEPVLRLVLLGQ